MKFQIENSIVASYKRFSYEPWYALAEFVDNSTQAYFDNQEELDKAFAENREKLTVKIDYDAKADTITITDNSIGMDEETLSKALKLGAPPANPEGRSRYGLGMKTAACWFGNLWTIRTKRLGMPMALEITIDVDKIAHTEGEVNLTVNELVDFLDHHGTTITIRKLNTKLASRTIGVIRTALSSMYRFDYEYGLHLYWNGQKLEWNSLEEKLYVQPDGTRYKKKFDFIINNKKVEGWVGVIGRGGSRRFSGFAIIQNRRVIENNYKPSSIFGEQEEGSNDLINQRVTGELFLEKFSVSHTKDKIVWEDDEHEQLDKELGEICKDAKNLALELRFRKGTQRDEMAKLKEAAVTTLKSELASSELKNYVSTVSPYPEKILNSSNIRISEKVVANNSPVITATIGIESDAIHVKVFFNETSEFEPYILTETTIDANTLLVIINILHPYIQEMTENESFTNFVRESIYDGVAEWKALKLRGTIEPNTIKMLKDGLLRIPYEIKSHKFL